MIAGINLGGGGNSGAPNRNEKADADNAPDKANKAEKNGTGAGGEASPTQTAPPAENSGTSAAPPVTAAATTNEAAVTKPPVGLDLALQDASSADTARQAADILESQLRQAAEAARADIAQEINLARVADVASAETVPEEAILQTYENGTVATEPVAGEPEVSIIA